MTGASEDGFSCARVFIFATGLRARAHAASQRTNLALNSTGA